MAVRPLKPLLYQPQGWTRVAFGVCALGEWLLGDLAMVLSMINLGRETLI